MDRARVQRPAAAIDGDQLALGDGLAVERDRPVHQVDAQPGGAAHGRPTQAAGNDRRVGGQAPPRRDDGFCGEHASQVAGRGLFRDQHHRFATLGQLHRPVAAQRHPPDGGAHGRRQTPAELCLQPGEL